MANRVSPIWLVSSAILAASSASAFAGDFANLNVLGFSADGSIFAFEEYGVQDGSGFPYANRFYIDTNTDQFIAGSPIRVRIDDETVDVSQARADAAAQGQSIITDEILSAHPGFLAGFNAVTESSADPYRMSVNPRPVEPPVDQEVEFRLTELTFASTGNCDGIQDITTGFKLVQLALEAGQETKLLHEDASVPSSRKCPNGYRIGGVHTYFPEGGEPVYAVTIAVRSFGFEGPDYNWMAVTTRDSSIGQP